jgi:hypothetical protein
MEGEKCAAFTGGLIVGIFICACFAYLIFSGLYHDLRKQAVVHGYAVWEVDNSGYTTFKWKEKTEKE